MGVTGNDLDRVTNEILAQIPKGPTYDQIKGELTDLTVKHLIKLDKAKVTVLKDHSAKHYEQKPVNKQPSHVWKKYIKPKIHNLRAIDSITEGMSSIQVRGTVDNVFPSKATVKGVVKDIVRAEISDDSGTINATFWWSFDDLQDGDEIIITYAYCKTYRDELNLNVSYETNVILNPDDPDNEDSEDDWEVEDDE